MQHRVDTPVCPCSYMNSCVCPPQAPVPRSSSVVIRSVADRVSSSSRPHPLSPTTTAPASSSPFEKGASKPFHAQLHAVQQQQQQLVKVSRLASQRLGSGAATRTRTQSLGKLLTDSMKAAVQEGAAQQQQEWVDPPFMLPHKVSLGGTRDHVHVHVMIHAQILHDDRYTMFAVLGGSVIQQSHPLLSVCGAVVCWPCCSSMRRSTPPALTPPSRCVGPSTCQMVPRWLRVSRCLSCWGWRWSTRAAVSR